MNKRTGNPPPRRGADQTKELEEAVDKASEYPEAGGSPPVKQVSHAKLIDLVSRAESERRRLAQASTEVDNQRVEVRKQLEEAQRLIADATARQEEAAAREHTLLLALREQVTRVAGLGDRNEQLRQEMTRLLSAEADRAIDQLDAIRTNGAASDELLATARDKAEQIIRAAEARAADVAASAEARADERERGLNDERDRLDAREAELQSRGRELDRKERQRDVFTAAIERDARAEVADELDDKEQQFARASSELHRLRSELESAQAELQLLRDSTRLIAGLPEAEVQALLERLTQQVADLKEDLDNAPPASTADELQVALGRAKSAEREANELRTRLAETDAAEAEHRRLSMAIGDLEQQQEEHEARAVRFQQRIGALRDELNLLSDAGDAEPPDQELRDIDVSSRERESDEVRWRQKPLTLRGLVDEAQARMAAAGRFYADADVRLFVAGLAASRLHILEGISGTGKTSLPIAFAKAIGGVSSIVEVQAAWRDRLDLVGTYNAFDRRYYPTDFARAVYQAATAGWRDTVCLVVLDEMNLAPPEYYFADVLSALESGKASLEVLPRTIGTAEALQEHRRIPIGTNVWFIGTANRDETTATIADKTYDRSNLMQLPDRYERFTPRDQGSDSGAVKVSVLEMLFGKAATDHEDVVADVLAAATSDELRTASARLRIGFGNRLDRLVERFVPVVVEAGGTRDEALDHVLATKLVRKLESRFDAKQDHLDAFESALRAAAGVDLEKLGRTSDELQRQRERLET